MIDLYNLDSFPDSKLKEMSLADLSELKNLAIYCGTPEQAQRVGRILDERLPRRPQYGQLWYRSHGAAPYFPWRWYCDQQADDGCDETYKE
jgi:hypothetical protein